MHELNSENPDRPSHGQNRLLARERLHASRKFIYAAVGLFLIGICLGVVFADRFEAVMSLFRKSVQHYREKSTLMLIGTIFVRNFSALIISTLLGIVFGLVPAAAALVNGILVGTTIFGLAGTGNLLKLLLIVPHGIFELPAAMIAWGLGMWHGAWFFRRDRKETMKERRRKVVLAFFRYCLPLLIIAAIIEGLMIR